MADREKMMRALRNAHKAGDVSAAKRIAGMIKNVGGEQKAAETVIATTDDGGRIVDMGGGNRSFVSDGFSTSDPDMIDKIMAGATPVEANQSRMDQERISNAPVAARAQEFVRGVPFAGEYFDEAVGTVSPKTADNMREMSSAMQRENPNETLALNVVGGIAAAAPLAGPAISAVGKAPGLLGKTAAGAVAGSTVGAVEGAVAGYGSGTTRKERRDNARKRGMAGAGIGGALGLVSPAVGAGLQRLVKRVKGIDTKTIANELGVNSKTAVVIKRHLMNDDLQAAANQLARGGDDAMLADAGIGTQQLLDTASQSGGKALRVANERVGERAAQAGQRLNRRLDDILGSADGVKTAARGISRRTSEIRQDAYTRAYSQPINYADGTGQAIEGVLERIPARTLQSAIKEANEAMQASGARNMQIMADIADDGSITFREMPNVQQLDEIKKALGDIASKEVDQFGRKTSAGIRAQSLARDLKGAISDAVPDYARAVKLGGDKIAEDNALDIGRRLLSKRTTVEEASEVLSGASTEAMQAAKRGMRNQIEETLSNVRTTLTDPNTDAREAMQLVRELSSRANMKKARLVLGNDAKALFDELDKAEAALTLRAAISTNSKTAVRQAGQEAVNEATQPGLIGSAAQGEFAGAGKKLVQALTGATDEAAVGRREQIFAEIADVLTSKRGAEAERALRVIDQAMKGQPIKEEQARQIVRAVGDPALLGTNQLLSQLLAPQR